MTTLDALVAAARRAHPAFRFAVAVAGLAAFVVVFAKFGVNVGTVTFGTIVFICLMTLFVVFGRIATLSQTVMRLPALVMLWFVVAIVGATVVLLFTSAFFDAPLPLRTRLIGATPAPNSPLSVAAPNRVRMALVAANWKYPSGRLVAPEHDMALVADALRKVGFRVRELPNSTRSEFLEAWQEVETVGRYGGVALLYYSGHGTRRNGADYIMSLPDDGMSSLTSRGSRSANTPRTDHVLMSVELAQAAIPPPADTEEALGIINASSLLAAIKPLDSEIRGASGDLALYSTSPGGVAVDVGPDGKHSPFATVFADTILTSNGDIRAVLDGVAAQTRALTAGRQVPWFAGTFLGEFTFNDRTKDDSFALLRMIVFDASRPESEPR
jgi:hypothetical protein